MCMNCSEKRLSCGKGSHRVHYFCSVFLYQLENMNVPKLFLEESVLKLDAGMATVAERHVV